MSQSPIKSAVLFSVLAICAGFYYDHSSGDDQIVALLFAFIGLLLAIGAVGTCIVVAYDNRHARPE